MQTRMSEKIRIGAFALILFCFDSLILSSGIIAAAILVVMIYRFFKLLLARQINLIQKSQLIAAGVYSLAAVLIFAVNAVNRKIAENRADLLISACEKYKARYGEYPQRLTDIVPEFVEKVPSAKYTLVENSFMYLADKEHHSLLYSVIPLGRRSYSFELRKWRND